MQSNAFGFTLSNGINTKKFICETKSELISWYAKLRKCCILSTFDDDFQLLNKIGKGFSANVYRVKSNLSGKFYAAKIFDKKTVQNSEWILVFSLILTDSNLFT